MYSEHVICSVCGLFCANRFTIANWKLGYCCDNCYSGNAATSLEPVPATLPLSEYISQGNLARMKQWVDYMTEQKQKMEMNLKEVDACISQIRSLADTVSAHCALVISKLECIKSLLQEHLNLAVAEAERTMFEQSPNLLSEWSAHMRNNAKNLKFFSYQIHSENLIKSLYEVQFSCPPIKSNELTNICGNQLTLFNINTRQYTQRTMARYFTDCVQCCLISPQELFCIDTYESSTIGVVVNLETNEMRETTACKVTKLRTALVAANYCCYMFGLHRERSHRCNVKYDAFRDCWTQLPEMSKSLDDRVAAYYRSRVYLVARYHAIEVFDIDSETFEQSSITYESDREIIFSTFVDNDLIILSSDIVRIWRIGCDRIEEYKATFRDRGGIVQNSVKYQNGLIWYIDSDSGKVMQYNVETKVLASFTQ